LLKRKANLNASELYVLIDGDDDEIVGMLLLWMVKTFEK